MLTGNSMPLGRFGGGGMAREGREEWGYLFGWQENGLLTILGVAGIREHL